MTRPPPFANIPGTHDVGFEVSVEDLDRRVDDVIELTGTHVPSVVDEHPHRPPTLLDPRGERAERCAVEKIGRKRHAASTGRLNGGHRLAQTARQRPSVAPSHGRRVLARLPFCGRPGRDDDVEASGPELHRHPRADPATRARDKRNRSPAHAGA
jgi:hypothetical protein